MIWPTLFALAALATPAGAQAPPTPPPGTRQIKIDVSPAGEAVIRKFLAERDPLIEHRAMELRDNARQIAALNGGPRLDLVRLQALLRQQESLQLAIKRRGDDRMLAMLGQLSEADRIKFVRSFQPAQPVAPPPARR